MAGAYSVGGIATNTSEDYVDELTTGIVYKYSEYVFSGFDEKKLTESDNDVMADALEGAKQTLKFSIMNAVIMTVTEYAITRLITVSGLIYTYIKGTSMASKVKSKGRGLFTSLGKKGGFLFKPLKLLGDLALGSQEERLAMAKMANDNAGGVTALIGQERQTQVHMLSNQRKQMLDTLKLNSDNKNLRDTKKLEAYNYKMKTGTWQKTQEDKNLFLSCVPREYIQKPFLFNDTFIVRLNSFKEYAVSSEGKLINLAQTHMDMLTSNNISKVN